MANLANTPRRLTIGSKILSIASLSERGELALYQTLKDIVSDGTDIWKRFEPSLKMLERAGRWADRAQVVEKISSLIAEGRDVTQDAVERARRTNPTVLAREIYQRAKPFHPDLDLTEVEAVVTPVNVEDLYLAMEQALGVSDDPKAIPSPSPSPS